MHDPRRHSSNGARVNAEPGGDTWTKALDDHVGALDQPPDDLLCIGRLEVQSNAALISVPSQVGGACSLLPVSAVSERRPHPHVITVIDGLNFDDIGAQIAKVLRAHRSRKNSRHVENPNAMEKRMRHVNGPYGALRSR